MLKSLQARLSLSYVGIILVCLIVIGLAAVALLRGYQRNLAHSRLSDRAVLAAVYTTQLLRRGASPQEAVDRLAQQSNRGDAAPTSIYLIDSTGHLIASIGELVDELAFRRWVGPAASLSDLPARGELRVDAGKRLLYVVEPVPNLADGEQTASDLLVLAELYRPMRSALGDLLPRLAWSGVIAFAVSLALAGLLAHSISRPLEQIARAAEEVADGNYRQELEISAPVEVAMLATSFTSMAHQVRATLQSQRDLVANISHELKTPLTSIQGFSQAMLDGTASDAQAQQRAAAVIHEEAGRMRCLVDDLLELARLESGQAHMAREPVDMADLLRECSARFAPMAHEFGSALETDVPSSLPLITGDPDRLSQVLGNLVNNALTHAHGAEHGPRVVIRGESREGWVVCSVTDNGPGIPTDELSRIFERFYQVERSRERRDGGAGLGLAIAREIVEGHGGHIRAESVQGLGARVTLELPVRP